MTPFLSRYFPRPHAKVEYVLGAILLAYPALLYAVRGGMNGALFLVALISIGLLVIYRKAGVYTFDRSVMLFGVAWSAGMLVVLVSQLYHHDVRGAYFDSNARFLLAAPMLVVLRRLDIRTLSLLQYAFPLGAISALIMVLATSNSLEYNASTSFLNHIHLGDTALMLGLLSLLAINWFGKDTLLVKLLKIAGLFAGLLISVISSARGGWVAIPAIVAIALYAHNREHFFRRLGIALALTLVAIVLAYVFIPPIHNRLWMIYSDLHNFSAGNADTSIGIRMQLWHAALHLFGQHPLLGVGADGFGRAMDGLAASGFLTPLAAVYGKAEVHSELLAQMVRFGILGLGFILALYFVPFYLCAKVLKAVDRPTKVAAAMGMSMTLGFFIFGLTVEIFDLKMTAAFYSFTVTALLAIATKGDLTHGASDAGVDGA